MAKDVDLNSANYEELLHLGPLGDRRAHQIMENRPFNNWDDVKSIPGFTDNTVHLLKEAHATIHPKK
jgi:DNA uptake protein ComE-like DNA-binding protein